MPPELIASIALGTFTLGLGLGAYLRNSAWAENAKGCPRMCWGGRLFYVVEEGDLEKARGVVEGMEDDLMRAWGRETYPAKGR